MSVQVAYAEAFDKWDSTFRAARPERAQWAHHSLGISLQNIEREAPQVRSRRTQAMVTAISAFVEGTITVDHYQHSQQGFWHGTHQIHLAQLFASPVVWR